MPYLHETVVDKEVMTRRPPFGPGFTVQEVQRAERMEVWGSGIKDPGGDYCEFRLMEGKKVLATRTISGY